MISHIFMAVDPIVVCLDQSGGQTDTANIRGMLASIKQTKGTKTNRDPGGREDRVTTFLSMWDQWHMLYIHMAGCLPQWLRPLWTDVSGPLPLYYLFIQGTGSEYQGSRPVSAFCPRTNLQVDRHASWRFRFSHFTCDVKMLGRGTQITSERGRFLCACVCACLCACVWAGVVV